MMHPGPVNRGVEIARSTPASCPAAVDHAAGHQWDRGSHGGALYDLLSAVPAIRTSDIEIND